MVINWRQNKLIGPGGGTRRLHHKHIRGKRMKKIKYIVVVFCFSIFFYNHSISSEKNVDQISKNLRCLICQGQSVYDSQSDFALSMKQLIQNKIDQGVEEDEIYKYLKEKYGEWIVYDPEVNKNTFLLWILPLILFIFGGLLIIRKVTIK